VQILPIAIPYDPRSRSIQNTLGVASTRVLTAVSVWPETCRIAARGLALLGRRIRPGGRGVGDSLAPPRRCGPYAIGKNGLSCLRQMEGSTVSAPATRARAEAVADPTLYPLPGTMAAGFKSNYEPAHTQRISFLIRTTT